MNKLEILKRIALNHNNLAQIMVSGDNAIYMGETLRDLRTLVQQLQADIDAEESAHGEVEKEG